MRIIAGELKGRRIEVPAGAELRPTMDRVREAVFSMLENAIEFTHCRAADLYAGSGALGFEALSRGVQSCVFVERDQSLAKQLKVTGQDLGLERRMSVVQGDVFRSLAAVRSALDGPSGQGYLILADPPYTAHPGAKLVAALAKAELFQPRTIFLLGCPKQLGVIDLVGAAAEVGIALSPTFQKSKTYGETVINCYGF